MDDYGEDSDTAKGPRAGIFPDASELQFIPTGLTDEAMKRVVTAAQVAHAPRIIGVDPAYSGVDDAVIVSPPGLAQQSALDRQQNHRRSDYGEAYR